MERRRGTRAGYEGVHLARPQGPSSTPEIKSRSRPAGRLALARDLMNVGAALADHLHKADRSILLSTSGYEIEIVKFGR